MSKFSEEFREAFWDGVAWGAVFCLFVFLVVMFGACVVWLLE